MKKIFTLFALLALFSFETNAQTVTRLIGASPFQDSLWVFDTANFNVVRRLAPTPSSGGAITGTNGIATNPSTNQIYVIVKQTAVTGRVLGRLDPLTGVVTIVGNLGDNFSSITFNGNSTLLGVTGDGATTPETVYRIDQTNANKTVLRTMGNGADGEVICYNSTDNMIYHWSGNGTLVYEKMDTAGVTITNIPLIGSSNGETFGSCYIGNNKFLISNIGSRFQQYNANGTVGAQYGNTSPDDIRGTTLLTCSRAITGHTSFCTGSSTILISQAANATYQWYLNGAAIPGATSQAHATNTPGHYNVFITDACGADSLGAGVDVIEYPSPVVTVSGAQSTICPNTSILLTGNNDAAMQWYLNGNPIPGATSDTYNATSPGIYNQLVTNSFGCNDTAATSFTLTAAPSPVVNIGNDTAICSGDTLTLDAGNAGANFVWSPSGNTAQTENVFAAGTYIVNVTNSFGCTTADTLVLTINAVPVISLPEDTAGCNAVLLDAGNPGAMYLWCDGSTTQTVVFQVSATCAVVVTGSNGCMSSDTVTVIIHTNPAVTVTTPADSLCPANPAITLTTTPAGGTLTGPGISGNTFTPLTAGPGTHLIHYMFTDTNGCYGADSIMLTVFQIPNLSMTVSASTVCLDDANVTLSGTPSGGNFTGTGVSGNTFDPSIAGLGTFTPTYIYTDTNGCFFGTATQITVNACVGVIENGVVNETALFPNPTSGSFTISVSATSSVTIFNTVGETVMNVQLAAGNHTLDMTGFAEGMYFVRTQNANGISTQRLILAH